MMLIDIHTHLPVNNNISIKNIVAGKEILPNLDSRQSFSIGIHPWFLDTFNGNRQLIEDFSHHKSIKAIGECGFDKNSGFPIELQTEIFKWHIDIAEKVNKPLIIHCVKAFNELINLKNKYKSTIPWILHGFNAPENIIHQCIRSGFCFSLGHQLFNSKTHIYKLAGILPRTHIFFETDESAIPIGDIYAQYSFLTGIPEKDLQQLIYTNFMNFFKNNL
jgi:TatD DNase family protein